MGKWFPGIRTGTAEQTADFRDAHKSLFRNSRYEAALRTADGKRAIREETPRYLDLNDRAADSGAPLSRTQQWWHWNRALDQEDREFTRLQQTSDRQARQSRTASRTRRVR
jgi:hypothetical protein